MDDEVHRRHWFFALLCLPKMPIRHMLDDSSNKNPNFAADWTESRLVNALQKPRSEGKTAVSRLGLVCVFWVGGELLVVLGGASFVAMVQSTDLTDHHNRPLFRRLNRSRLWPVLTQRSVRISA